MLRAKNVIALLLRVMRSMFISTTKFIKICDETSNITPMLLIKSLNPRQCIINTLKMTGRKSMMARRIVVDNLHAEGIPGESIIKITIELSG